MPYKSSNRRRPKAKTPGKFEIGAFGLVIGFAVGLTCGILMGGLTRSSTTRTTDDLQRTHQQRASSDQRVERLEASMKRLKDSGTDIEILKERYTPEKSSKVDKLNNLLVDDYGAISIEDL